MVERSGREALRSGEVKSSRMATLTLRKSADTSGLTEGDRVTARGATWNIRSISQVDRAGAWLEMVIEGPVT